MCWNCDFNATCANNEFPPCESSTPTYPTLTDFPPVGELDTIYIDQSTWATYIWDGGQYVPWGADTTIYDRDGTLTWDRVMSQAWNDMTFDSWVANQSNIFISRFNANTPVAPCATSGGLGYDYNTWEIVRQESTKIQTSYLGTIIAPTQVAVTDGSYYFALQDIWGWTWTNTSSCPVKLYVKFLFNTKIENLSQNMSYTVQDRYQITVNGALLFNKYIQHGWEGRTGNGFNLRDHVESPIGAIIPAGWTAVIRALWEGQRFFSSWGTADIIPSVQDVNIIAYPV